MRAAVAVVATLMLFVALPLSPAAAQEGSLDVVSTDVSGYPEVRFVITAPEALVGSDVPAEAFAVTEDRVPRHVTVSRLPSDDLQVVLLVDTSGSMNGEPLTAARAAAASFINQMPDQVQIAVVGFGSEPVVASAFGSPRNEAVAAVEALQAQGETALYDAVVAAMAQFPAEAAARRVVVLLSDGGDTVSSSGIQQAVEALDATGVTLFGIELQSAESDPQALATLAGATAGGAVVPASDPAALTGVYEQIASSLVNQYAVSYTSEAHGSTVVRLTLSHAGVFATAEGVIDFPAAGVPAAPPPLPQPQAAVPVVPGVWASGWVLILGGLAVFLALAWLFLVLFLPGEPRLRLAGTRGAAPVPVSRSALADAKARASAAAERQLERRGWLAGLNVALERAGIDLRPGEFLVATLLAATGGFVVGALLSGLLLAIVLGAAVVVGARVYVRLKAKRRQARFADQLADTLQLLVGSLRAGYGFMQAVDAVAREADAPTAEEFRRLVVETRLSRDLNDALRAMVARVESLDFEWVVEAIQINREAGGDLAEILATVAGTIRERNTLRRQVKALSAEGRLSAYILLALPFGVGGLIWMTNPGYLRELYTTPPGLVMLVVAGLLMTVGAVWLRKMTKLVF